jgi:hypothetical protein
MEKNSKPFDIGDILLYKPPKFRADPLYFLVEKIELYNDDTSLYYVLVLQTGEQRAYDHKILELQAEKVA